MQHERPAHLAHHFDTPQQQFESGKQAMWLFLATEILLFGGLFCAYAIYRANHPEIFVYASEYLDPRLGGLNTVILICSSLSMAWAVRCAQRSQRTGLIVNLILTLLFACGFLGVKTIEYQHKWKDGLLPGKYFHPQEHGSAATLPATSSAPGAGGLASATGPATATKPALASSLASRPAQAGSVPSLPRSSVPQAALGPTGLAKTGPETGAKSRDKKPPRNLRLFFSIYFAMTGLHGLHVIAGMAVIAWVLVRSVQGHFSSEYFTPVDLAGLYWHLVDMIWIYLFPLLYLIR